MLPNVYLLIVLDIIFFFFSSRRRHTRCLSDWSSDVCSSDLRRGHASCRPESGLFLRASRPAREEIYGDHRPRLPAATDISWAMEVGRARLRDALLVHGGLYPISSSCMGVAAAALATTLGRGFLATLS